MLLLLSFLILDYFARKINGKKIIRHIESDFKTFKLAATTDSFILEAVHTFCSDETTTTAADVFNKLLDAKNITEFIEISDQYRIPIQHLLYEWNYVPAQESPKHIFNVLNDDCIQEIMRRLSDARDFLNAAKTCQQFQMNSLQCCSASFKRLSLSTENRPTALSVELTSNFLKIFGHLVRALEIIHDFDEDTLNMIVNYCGKNLIALDIVGKESTTVNLNVLSKFKALEFIQISSISLNNVELPPNLCCIFLIDVKVNDDLQFVVRSFPNLKSVFFQDMVNLSESVIIAFIEFNPQLENLMFRNCQKLTSSALNEIIEGLPNLTRLRSDIDITTITQYNELVMNLSQLRELKSLDISFASHLSFPANILFDSLAANIPTIQSLWIFGLRVEEASAGLLALRQLEELSFTTFQSNHISIDDLIIQIINGLPILRYICFDCNTISISEIANILQHTKSVTQLSVLIDEIDIDLSAYRSILALIKSHLNVRFIISRGNIDESIFKENMQQFQIIK